jgi:hypothetical protein
MKTLVALKLMFSRKMGDIKIALSQPLIQQQMWKNAQDTIKMKGQGLLFCIYFLNWHAT